MNLGLDLGSSRIVIYEPGAGVVLDEPSAIAVDSQTGRVIAWGEEAASMMGRTPASIRAEYPVRNGVIAEFELAEKLLRHCLQKVCSNRITKPCVAVSIAEKVTEVEQRSFIDAVVSVGARRVTLVPETVAAAIGAGVDVSQPRGRMLVNVGGGTTDVSVLSLKGQAVCDSVRMGGVAMDEAIVRYLRTRYGLIISLPMAERIKHEVGCALPQEPTLTVVAKGRDSFTGLPRTQEVNSDEICQTIREPLQAVTALVAQVLEHTPPELAGDIMEEGILLTGGVARLPMLPELIERVTGIRCRVAEDPARCVAVGAGMALQYASAFSAVYDLGDFSYRLSDSVTN